jgi:hypothetical protein
MHAGPLLILRAPLNLVASCMTYHKAASERDERIAVAALAVPGPSRETSGAAAPDIAAEFSQRKPREPRVWKAVAEGWHCPARAAGDAIGGIGVSLLFSMTAIRDAPDHGPTRAGSPR